MQLIGSLTTSLDGHSVRMLLKTPPVGASGGPGTYNISFTK